jgi:hypothetical protein
MTTKSAKAAKLTPRAAAVAGDATTLTDDQMQALAQAFHDIASEVSQVRIDAITAGAALSDPRIVHLQGIISALLNTSTSLALQDANLTLEDADEVVNQITQATAAADKALHKLANIDKAVNIASSVIVLAGAITTKNPGQIIAAAKGVAAAAGFSL